LETLPISLLKELTDFKIDSSIPLKDTVANFYEILRKYGIKRGTRTETGSIACNTPEYVLCLTYFEKAFHFWVSIDVGLDLGNFLPEDLECY